MVEVQRQSPPRRGLMLVISSPSGAGKTSLARRLVSDHAELELSVSATTRAPRPGEQHGREYHFITHADFEGLVAEDKLLEWAKVHDHHYGTPRDPVLTALAGGRDILFDIDWQGAECLARQAPDDVVRVFVLPPTMNDLRRRLLARAQDGASVIERRLLRAPEEIARWAAYDYVLVNDDFDRTYSDLVNVYHAERLKRARNPWLTGFVAELLD